MGVINNPENISKQVADWVNKNMTKNTAEALANTLYKAISTVLTAPFDIALALVDIIQHRKYSRFIVTIWSVIGASVLLLSLILYLVNGSFPFNAWGLGVAIASAAVLWIAKHPIQISVSSTLSEEIEAEIARLDSVPTLSPEVIGADSELGSLYADELFDDEEDDELLDDDDEEDDELLDDDDDNDEDDNETSETTSNMNGIPDSTGNDIYEDILSSISATSEDSNISFEDLSIQRDVSDFLNNRNM